MRKKASRAENDGKGKQAASEKAPAGPGTGQLVWLCVAAWLIPGCGHYILSKKGRALILGGTIITMFLFGLLMKGEFYALRGGEYLRSLGFLGEMCVGAGMPVAKFFGYPGGDPFFVSSDFGTAFLVCAGMLNVLTILDAYDIAMGRKP